MNTPPATKSGWNLRRHERISIIAAICALVAFGFLQERRTALRHAPMTDLGVFCIASGAIWSGENPYAISDWHGWHYQYPPALAILFLPLAEPVPLPPAPLPPGELKTAANTPWGYAIDGKNYYGLHAENTHFFFVVAAWYVLSLLGILLSAHAARLRLGRSVSSAPRRRKMPCAAAVGGGAASCPWQFVPARWQPIFLAVRPTFLC